MRIDFNSGPQAVPEAGRSSQGASNNSASGRAQANEQANAQAASALSEDQAQLSGGHVQVQALTAQAAQLPDIRQARVESLRQAVLGGAYHPEPEQVAQALIDHMIVQKAA